MLVLGLVVRLGLGLRTEIKYFKTCAIYLNAIIKRYTNKAYRYLYFFYWALCVALGLRSFQTDYDLRHLHAFVHLNSNSE